MYAWPEHARVEIPRKSPARATVNRALPEAKRARHPMRIHSVDAIAIDIPLKKNFGGATYSVLKRSTVITRLRTVGGLTSEVYNGDNREHAGALSQQATETIGHLGTEAGAARFWCETAS